MEKVLLSPAILHCLLHDDGAKTISKVGIVQILYVSKMMSFATHLEQRGEQMHLLRHQE